MLLCQADAVLHLELTWPCLDSRDFPNNVVCACVAIWLDGIFSSTFGLNIWTLQLALRLGSLLGSTGICVDWSCTSIYDSDYCIELAGSRAKLFWVADIAHGYSLICRLVELQILLTNLVFWLGINFHIQVGFYFMLVKLFWRWTCVVKSTRPMFCISRNRLGQRSCRKFCRSAFCPCLDRSFDYPCRYFQCFEVRKPSCLDMLKMCKSDLHLRKCVTLALLVPLSSKLFWSWRLPFASTALIADPHATRSSQQFHMPRIKM